MSERCEPPPGWREVQWHILESDREFWMGPPQPRTWQAPASWDAVNGVWWNNFDLAAASPFDAAASGWRYLAPVTPPATVAALVEALKKCADDLEARVMREYSVGILTPGVALRQAEDLAPVDAARAALALYRDAGR